MKVDVMINRLSWIEYRLAVECSREYRWTKTAMRRTEREPYHSWTSSQTAKPNDRITCRLCRRQSDIECKRISSKCTPPAPVISCKEGQLLAAAEGTMPRHQPLGLEGIDNPVSIAR